ncbi:class I SAM-dependent methyltransferase [Candidatus Woesearchaeota archaeon]|nr:class I SAM-dependent methyltransferase [Candidatus Woesearchaeota archaeon]
MKIQPFETHTQRYEDWFDRNRFAYESELEAVKAMLPRKGYGVEIGVGSGRFAAPLGIEHGIEPSPKMGAIAEKRGVIILGGTAENLFSTDETFDYALMVTTLCFLEDVDAAFKEAHRILTPKGYFINGFVDRKSEIGRSYEKHKQESPFYREATFYSVDEVVEHLQRAGFGDMEFNQTIFHPLGEIEAIEPIKPGYGEGSFVVIKAKKIGGKIK